MEDAHSLRHSHSQPQPQQQHSFFYSAGTHTTSASEPVANGGTSAAIGVVGSLNGAKYRLMSPAKLPISRSPCITVPPGLSPTSFLESPVLLSNIMAEPSPTTGSFFKPGLMPESRETAALSFEKINTVDETASGGFEFKFQTGSSSAPGLSSFAVPAVCNGLGSQVQDQRVSQSPDPSSLVSHEQPSSKELRLSTPHDMSLCSAVDELNQAGNTNLAIQVSSSEQKDSISSVTADRTSEDGYNWRKYGQKLVKGSEFPRSYYKCTYPNCEVKKIFERSPTGQITEIVYKGSHDHPKPQAARRHNPSALVAIQEEKMDRDLSLTGQEDKLNANNLESNVSPMSSPAQANEEGLDGSASQIQGINDDIDEEDPFSKRRKMEDGLDVTPVVKPIREPRVVVQTVSEVDILDDGYRWRKYGQKVVRGNPNPRSYYKCTNAGCPVRKHVERASHDPKAVITTYEGKHNHDVPTAKNNNHEFTGNVPYVGAPKIREEESSGSISLDLGVGMSRAANRHAVDAGAAHGQVVPNNSNMMMGQGSQMPACYSIANGGLNLYGNRENRVEGHSFQAPPVHASNQCQQNVGRILMGP